MDTADVLRPGTEVDIAVTYGWVTRTVASHIVHVVDKALYLAVPGAKDLSTVLPSGLVLTLYIKPDNGLYMAKTEVLGYTKRGPLRLVVARPVALERVERRQYTRVPVHIQPEQCEAFFSRSVGWITISPTIVNISVGGVLLRHHQFLTQNTALKMRFRLPNGAGPIQVEARVLHGWKVRYKDQRAYLMGVQFTKIAVQDSEAIVRFVEAQERLTSSE